MPRRRASFPTSLGYPLPLVSAARLIFFAWVLMSVSSLARAEDGYDPRLTPEKYLLWFHHLPWDYRMASGRTLWDELVIHYSRGVDYVHDMRGTWAELAPYVDSERHEQISAFLAIQEKEARWWRDATLAYFHSLSKRPFPSGYAPPQRTLEEYEALTFPYAPGNPGWTAAPIRR